MGTCERCGKPLVRHSGRGRQQTRFCSRECKDLTRAEAQKAGRLAVKAAAGLTCEQCGKPLPVDASGRTRFCSRDCGVAYHNQELAEEKHEKVLARRAARPPCAFCGNPIPDTMRNGTIYCSKRCRIAANLINWHEKSPGYMRQYLYGVTPEEFAVQLAAQEGRCAICGSGEWPAPGKNNNGRPHVEHDPATGKIRGLTCGRCNLGMGHFKHDPARLIAAAWYLLTAAATPAGMGYPYSDPALLRGAVTAFIEASAVP